MKRYEPMLRLKIRRIEMGLTQKELADKIQIGQNLVSCYETGANFPSRTNLDKLASALECDVKEII